MVELSKEKKEQISNYDRQITVIQEFLTKVWTIVTELWTVQGKNEQKTSVFYHTLLDERERIEAEAEQLEEALQNMQEQQQETERILLTLDLQELECHLDEANYEREQKEKAEKSSWKEAVEELRQTVTEKESVQYFLNYAKSTVAGTYYRGRDGADEAGEWGTLPVFTGDDCQKKEKMSRFLNSLIGRKMRLRKIERLPEEKRKRQIKRSGKAIMPALY